jgi:hypothetical protein
VSEQALQHAKRNHLSISTKTVISFLTEIFRRLNAHFTPFYTQNVVHAALCVETNPAARKTQSFVAFDENSVISFLIEIFRRLNAHFISFYSQNAVHNTLCVGTSPVARKTQSFVDFVENCYFVPDWDISTFKRSFYSILHAERSAHCFMCRNKPFSLQIAMIWRLGRKLFFRSWLRYFDV